MKELLDIYDESKGKDDPVNNIILTMFRAAAFEQNNEQVPDEAEKFIHDNYHVYGAVSDKRDILVKMVSKEFNVDEFTASIWISETTT